MDTELLVEHVFVFAQSPKNAVAAEALWVLTNAVVCSLEEDLKTFVRICGRSVIQTLCHWLRNFGCAGSEAKLCAEVLSSLERLLGLRLDHGEEFRGGETSIVAMVEECQGFELIEAL